MDTSLIDYAGASRMLRLAETTVRRYVSLGRLPHFKVSNRVFFSPSELEQWLEERHVPAKGRGEW